MLEDINDMISLIVMIISVIAGLWLLFAVSDRHHADTVKRREERYFRLYEDLEDASETDDDQDGPYYG